MKSWRMIVMEACASSGERERGYMYMFKKREEKLVERRRRK
jgi:hypothetical protein